MKFLLIKSTIKRIICILSVLTAYPLIAQNAYANTYIDALDEDTKGLLVDAVEVASDCDFYHSTCRFNHSKTHTYRLNKKIVNKFKVTVLLVKDELFPEQSYSKADERLKVSFAKMLKQEGGCIETKKSGLFQKLNARYLELMNEIDDVVN